MAERAAPPRSAARVALVAPIAPLRGGIAHHTEALADALVRLGHDVRVLSYRQQYPRLLFPGRSEVDPGARPTALPVARLLTGLGPFAALRGTRALQAFDPHLVVAAWWNAAITLPVAAVLAEAHARGRAGVVMAHNTRSHDGGRLDAVAWRVMAALADGAVVHARTDAERLAREHSSLRVVAHPHPPYDRFAVAPPSRATARAALGVSADAELCLVLGNVRPYKGADIALRAVGGLLAARDRLQLVVAGEIYQSAREAIRAAQPTGGGDRVRVTGGYVSDDEVALWVAAADVLLAPHRRASHSGVVQVARAAGLPVIVSDVGGLRELTEGAPGCVLVPPGDVDALRGAVDSFFSAPHERGPPMTADDIDASWEGLARAVLRAGALSSGTEREGNA